MGAPPLVYSRACVLPLHLGVDLGICLLVLRLGVLEFSVCATCALSGLVLIVDRFQGRSLALGTSVTGLALDFDGWRGPLRSTDTCSRRLSVPRRPLVWAAVWFHLMLLVVLVGSSFSFVDPLASLPRVLTILRAATPELVCRVRGRPLGLWPVTTGQALGVGSITNVAQILTVLALGDPRVFSLPWGLLLLRALVPCTTCCPNVLFNGKGRLLPPRG